MKNRKIRRKQTGGGDGGQEGVTTYCCKHRRAAVSLRRVIRNLCFFMSFATIYKTITHNEHYVLLICHLFTMVIIWSTSLDTFGILRSQFLKSSAICHYGPLDVIYTLWELLNFLTKSFWILGENTQYLYIILCWEDEERDWILWKNKLMSMN